MKYYSISEVSALMGISNELLRHYERLGLISPERDENGYRRYTAMDVDKLSGVRRYKNMQFPLEQVEKLMYGTDRNEMAAQMHAALLRVRREITWNSTLLEALEDVAEEWEAPEENLAACEVTVSPEVLRIPSRQDEIFEQAEEPALLREWLERMPVVFISPLFTKEDILSSIPRVQFGYGVRLPQFKALRLPHMRQEIYYPARKCITTVIFSAGSGRIHAGKLLHAVEYCNRCGFQIAGDGWGITIGNCVKNGEDHRYHRVYIPIE